jgi:hypothetical protein
MGVGSEVFGAVSLDRKGLGIELKPSYFRQAVANLRDVGLITRDDQIVMDFGSYEDERDTDEAEDGVTYALATETA